MKTILGAHRRKLLAMVSIIMVLILGIPLYGCDEEVDTSNVVESGALNMVQIPDGFWSPAS